MPLVHSKTPKAFKKNIEIEMEHGKPQKQAVAIAYHEKAKAEHKKHLAHGGVASCSNCKGAGCYECKDPMLGLAKGGEVEEEKEYKSGHEHRKEGEKRQAEIARREIENNRGPRSGDLGESLKRSMPKLGLAKGGEVSGVHTPVKQMSSFTYDKEKRGSGHNLSGVSEAGEYAREGRTHQAKEYHREVLGEMRSMKKPNLYADGGEVSDFAGSTRSAFTGSSAPDQSREVLMQDYYKAHPEKKPQSHADGGEIEGLEEHEESESPEEESMEHLLGGELMSAFEKKDKKQFVECLEAMILHVMSKES